MANPIAELIYSIGRKRGATPMEIKSAFETGIVESGLRNLPGGSGDSAGWRQERRSLYPNPTNLEASINRYFDETEAVRGKYGRAGDLAAAVQRPRAEYRSRYQEHSGDADALLKSLGGATAARSGRGAGVSVSGSVSPGQVSGNEFNPGEGTGAGSPLLGLLGQQAPQAPPVAIPQAPLAPFISPQVTAQAPQSGIEGLLQAVQTSPQEIPQTTVSPGSASISVKGTPSASGSPSQQSGTTTFEGTKVAAWIAPELEYARRHGWKGTVSSGFRSFAKQAEIYNSGARPAAKPGTSNHEGATFPRGAVDVTDAATLARILRRKGSPLKWAGGKDPVHFSHPHGGSY